MKDRIGPKDPLSYRGVVMSAGTGAQAYVKLVSGSWWSMAQLHPSYNPLKKRGMLTHSLPDIDLLTFVVDFSDFSSSKALQMPKIGIATVALGTKSALPGARINNFTSWTKEGEFFCICKAPTLNINLMSGPFRINVTGPALLWSAAPVCF